MMILLIKQAAIWLWIKCPTIIKFYIGAVVIPNILVFGIIFFIFGVAFIDDRIQSHTGPMKAVRDRQLEEIVKNSNHELKLIHSEFSHFSRKQDMMMQELMRRGFSNTNTP